MRNKQVINKRKWQLLSTTIILLSLGVYFVLANVVMVNKDIVAVKQTAPSTATDADDTDCEIDQFLLEHANERVCLSTFEDPSEKTIALLRRAETTTDADPWKRTQDNFVNWENPHVHPLDITPNGRVLLAVNTADNSLMVFNITNGTPVLIFTAPVGLDPVSVRARTDREYWVVNHASDSVSIVSFDEQRVVATLQTNDEPADVIFGGTPQRAFVTASQANQVQVFNPANLNAEPQSIFINGEDPRALAVSNDGSEVYVAIFESGNATTILAGGKPNANVAEPVTHPDGPYGGIDVPPNDGNSYNPPINPNFPPPPAVSMIVRKDNAGRWMDDNNGDWTRFVSGDLAGLGGSFNGRVDDWDMPDRDVAIIDTSTLEVTYQTRMMNALMAMDVNPTTGEVTVVGTDATNEIRWEPNLNGTFLRVNMATFTPGATNEIIDLNPRLDYSVSTLPQSERDRSIGDPRGIAWNEAGTSAYITGMGSNNVIGIDANGNRRARIEVGEGPTGIKIKPNTNTAYVLNKFEGSISVINLANNSETDRITYYDPTPQVIKEGRPHLYDTHATSGLGHISCASCHIDGRTDRLAWDLGNPAGEPTTLRGFDDLNPGTIIEVDQPAMKGPLLTMTLQDIVGHPSMHWSGDKADLGHFSGAFASLQGDDSPLSNEDVAKFETFLDSITIPANPYRNLDNSISTSVEIPGPNGTVYAIANAEAGRITFERSCRSCHPGNTGRGNTIRFNGTVGEGIALRPPTWRNFYERMGLWYGDATASNAGYSFEQDGIFDTTFRSLNRNTLAFMLSFNGKFPYEPAGLDEGNYSKDTHAAVGKQVMLSDANISTENTELLNQLVGLAETGAIGLVAKGEINGELRGYMYTGDDMFQSDREAEQASLAELQSGVAAGGGLVFTAVAGGSAERIGIDKDMDGTFDRDELDANTSVTNVSSLSQMDRCATTTNVARLGSATQSSLFQGTRFPAVNAIDGNYGNFAHTDTPDNNATWEVRLDQDYEIDEIVIHSRRRFEERMRDITVHVLDETGEQILFRSHFQNRHNRNDGPAQIVLDLREITGASVEGRIVRILRTADLLQLHGSSIGALNIAEVEVFACEAEEATLHYGSVGNRNQNWSTQPFGQNVGSDPVVFPVMQTFNGSDTATLGVRNVSDSGFDVRVDEEQSRDSETQHSVGERVDYLAMDVGLLKSADNTTIGETSRFSMLQPVANEWQTIHLHNTYSNPVIFMNRQTINGSQFTLRMRNVTDTSFEFQLDEWTYLDGAHTVLEEIGWLVVESGTHTLSDGSQLVVGTSNATQAFSTIGFDAFGSTPTVYSFPQTGNGANAFVTRHRNVSNNSFDVLIQEEEAIRGGSLNETVGFIAIGQP